MRRSAQCSAARARDGGRTRVEPRQLHARAREPRAGVVRRGGRGVEALGRAGGAVSERDADRPHPAASGGCGTGACSAATRRAALTLLEPVRPYDHARTAEFWPAYLRGLAHLRLRHGREALGQFREIVEHRGEAADSPLYPLAHLGLARAAALAGDTSEARKAYEAFLSLWNGADSDLRPLQEARREYATLRR